MQSAATGRITLHYPLFSLFLTQRPYKSPDSFFAARLDRPRPQLPDGPPNELDLGLPLAEGSFACASPQATRAKEHRPIRFEWPRQCPEIPGCGPPYQVRPSPRMGPRRSGWRRAAITFAPDDRESHVSDSHADLVDRHHAPLFDHVGKVVAFPRGNNIWDTHLDGCYFNS
jgi:hypothetical protein